MHVYAVKVDNYAILCNGYNFVITNPPLLNHFMLYTWHNLDHEMLRMFW